MTLITKKHRGALIQQFEVQPNTNINHKPALSAAVGPEGRELVRVPLPSP